MFFWKRANQRQMNHYLFVGLGNPGENTPKRVTILDF